jgi:hypothetical protein
MCDLIWKRENQLNGSDEAENLGESEEDLLQLDVRDAYASTVAASDWTVETLIRQIDRGNVDLDPAFQRREAWDRIKQSRYIESLIVGLPIPQIVLAEKRNTKGRFLVLDGKQRLLGLKKFYSGDLVLRGLDLRPDLNGLAYSEMPEEDRNVFDNQTLRTVSVRNWQSEDFLYLVFHRLNTASVPLSPQELRAALHPGPFISFANTFTGDHPEFAQLFRKNATVDFRMRDVEILVRFFAFQRFLTTYNGSLKVLLDGTCNVLNEEFETSGPPIESHAFECLKAIKASTEIFHEFAFRVWNHQELKFEARFNRAVFDAVVFSLSDPTLRESALLKKHEVVNAFIELCKVDAFIDAVSSTTKTKEAVVSRVALWSDALARVVNVRTPTLELKDGRIGYAFIP